MKAGWTISAAAHAIVLGWGLVTFASRPLNATPPEFITTDIISAADFSQITQGIRTAPKAETPKPLVEKVAEAKPVEEQNAKVVENKPEIVATSDQVQPPKPPEPKKAEPKPPVPVPQPKPEPKTQQKAEPPPKKAEPAKPQPKFDASRIAALLDKRDPQRKAATGDTLNNTPSLGTATGRAVTLSQNELDALRARLRECWNVPVGVAEARDLIVTVRIQFKPDGSLQTDPRLMNSGSHPAFQVAAESAMRAVRTCAPYSFLPAAKYEAWKDVIVDFDPRDMFRG